jgi:hypothetical protein
MDDDRTETLITAAGATSRAAGVAPGTAFPPPEFGPPQPAWRRALWLAFQLFLVGLVCTVAWSGWHVYRTALSHLRAVDALQSALHARVNWDIDEDTWLSGGSTRVSFSQWPSSEVINDDLRHVTQLRHIEWLDLNGCDNITDDGLAHLSALKDLKLLALGRISPDQISIDDRGVFPASAPRRSGATPVRTGNESEHVGPHITDRGLAFLERLTALEDLNLSGANISDAGLARLTGLVNLKELDLTNTPITDAGLVHLRGLVRLRHLSLNGTKVSSNGAVGLMQAIPGLEVGQTSALDEQGTPADVK